MHLLAMHQCSHDSLYSLPSGTPLAPNPSPLLHPLVMRPERVPLPMASPFVISFFLLLLFPLLSLLLWLCFLFPQNGFRYTKVFLFYPQSTLIFFSFFSIVVDFFYTLKKSNLIFVPFSLHCTLLCIFEKTKPSFPYPHLHLFCMPPELITTLCTPFFFCSSCTVPLLIPPPSSHPQAEQCTLYPL